jgi:hypothetical protein
MRIFAGFAVVLLALAVPMDALGAEEGAAAPTPEAPAEQPPAPDISTDAKDGRAATEGYAHPSAMIGRPLMTESPLAVEARKRAPKDLWEEMGVIEKEMTLYAGDGRYDMLPHLAERWTADMNAAFLKVYERAITPRQVGLKRAVLSCARVPNEVRGAVDLGQPEVIDRSVALLAGCNKLFARFLPPDITGLPDEFAGYRDPAGVVPTEFVPAGEPAPQE